MIKKMIYIASPYRIGDQAMNVRRSLEAANQLLAEGYIPFCPLLSHFWHMITPHKVEDWMEIDKHYLLRCDAVLRLDGESAGADQEEVWAKEFGLPVFYSIGELILYDIKQGRRREHPREVE